MNYLTPYNFYFELPLYTPVLINESNTKEFLGLADTPVKVEAYNPSLKENSTYLCAFERVFSGKSNIGQFYNIRKATATCLRTTEVYEYYFYLEYEEIENEEEENTINRYLIKIGQKPSIADLHISQVKDYSKVLSKEKIKEFTKAIGLCANGVGIGSFVYLRRIFEHLVEEAHSKAKTVANWDETIFQGRRMNEKIELLKNQLPDFLVEHRQLYGILSKGIHELTEDECLKYFFPVKTGIEVILDEKVAEFEKKQKLEKASQAIKNIQL